MERKFGKRAVVTEVYDGLGYKENDRKYIYPALHQMVTIKHVFNANRGVTVYLTDFFLSEFMDQNNDYVYYGFLKVTDGNLTWID